MKNNVTFLIYDKWQNLSEIEKVVFDINCEVYKFFFFFFIWMKIIKMMKFQSKEKT